MPEGTGLPKGVVVSEAGFIGAGTTETIAQLIITGSPDASGTVTLSSVVPADGAELIAARFTVTSQGTVTTSGTHQWSISDGTNVLATMAATSATTATGTVIALTTGTATNGKAIATTAGSRLILTNTEAGTIGDGIHGRFTFVWGL